MAELQIDSKVVAGMPTIYLQGEFDSYSAPRVRGILDLATEGQNPTVIVEMTKLDYIDSAGLGVLVSTLKLVNDRQGGLALVGLVPGVTRVFRVTGLDTIFTICGDEAEARERLLRDHVGAAEPQE
jgi:anti-sigma B factor antagonist